MRPNYFDLYPNYAIDRTDAGVITLRLHTEEGPALFDAELKDDFSRVLDAIGQDRDNRVLLLTGTGDSFMSGFGKAFGEDTHKPLKWDVILWESRRGLQLLADLPMPIVSAINGPARIHSEWVLLGDVTIAAETADFQDLPHLAGRVVPGDGIHVVWEELLGLNRARYAALTQQVIGAEEALRLGMVNEVVPWAQLMPRALEVAEQLATLPQLTLRLTSLLLRQRISQRLTEGSTLGLALEGLTQADKPYQGTA